MMINSLEAIVVKTEGESKSLNVIEARDRVNDPKFIKQVAEGEVDISISNNKDLQDILSKNVEEYKSKKEVSKDVKIETKETKTEVTPETKADVDSEKITLYRDTKKKGESKKTTKTVDEVSVLKEEITSDELREIKF